MLAHSRYARAALRDEIDRIRSAVPGGMKMAAYGAARAVGQLVGAGLLEHDSVRDALMSAAADAGLTEREAREHVGRGLRKGVAQPRDVPAGVQGERSIATCRPRSESKRRDPVHMSAAEASGAWRCCTPANDDDEVSAYLTGRAIDPDATALWDLARVLPPDSRVPWASYRGKPWSDRGHRLVLPLWNAHGQLAGFRARRVRDGDSPKDLSPAGFAAAGLVFACPLAQQVLATGQRPDWWGDAPLVVHVTEGGPDFLTLASRTREEWEHAPMVLGVFSGSWTPEIAKRVPTGSRVVLALHADATGRTYAKVIGTSLTDRCDVAAARIGERR